MKYRDEWDLSTIPDDRLKSEWASRSARKRKSYTGGLLWAKHNPDCRNCRCQRCTNERSHSTAL